MTPQSEGDGRLHQRSRTDREVVDCRPIGRELPAIATEGGSLTQPFGRALKQPIRGNTDRLASPPIDAQQSRSLADRIERMGRALNAEELAEILNVSKITIFKQAKGGGCLHVELAPAGGLIQSLWLDGCEHNESDG